MWFDYMREVSNNIVHIDEKGFYTYKINNGEMFITHFYIKPKYRNLGNCTYFMDLMVKEARIWKATHMTCVIHKDQNNANVLPKIYSKYGNFKLEQENEHVYVMVKDL